MRILVAGRAGQVARSLAQTCENHNFSLSTLGRPALNILDDSSVKIAFQEIKPDLIINAAAYTAVDAAETDARAAHELNSRAAANLSAMAAKYDAPILHLSTDYVFDGTKTEPYHEADPVCPLGVYGESKRDGEIGVAKANPKHLILRTAWVYSPYGKNFVKTMLRVSETRDELSVVADQLGNPTSAQDIADALIAIAEVFRRDKTALVSGTYHLAGSGNASWADLAEHILNASAKLGGPNAKIKRITSKEYPTPVTRPANSRLDCTKLFETYGIRLPHWRESSRKCVEQLIKTRNWS